MRFRLLLGLAPALLAGCASTLPLEIRTAPKPDVTLAAARANPDALRGATVRWGGHIIAVQNSAHETLVEVMSRRLDSDGEPLDEDASTGRFLVKLKGFVDPATFAVGRALTVRGKIDGVIERPIGDYPYRYVVVKAERVYLWPPRPRFAPYPYVYYPYYYDPLWWDPWYPWGPPMYRVPYPRTPPAR